MDSNVWDERYAGDDLVWSAEPNRFLVAEVETLPPGRALDLACGEGRNAVWLAERGWDVTGVDFSNVGLDKARRLADARGVSVQWELADVTEYTPAPRELRPRDRHVSASPRSVASLGVPARCRRGRDREERCLSWVTTSRTAAMVGAGRPMLPCCTGRKMSSPTWTDSRPVKAERVRRPVPTDDGEKIAIDVLVRATRTPQGRP